MFTAPRVSIRSMSAQGLGRAKTAARVIRVDIAKSAFWSAIDNTRHYQPRAGAQISTDLGRQGKRRRQPFAWSGVASVCRHIDFGSAPEPTGRDQLQGQHYSDGKARQRGSRTHRAASLQPKRLEEILSAVLHRRKERAERRTTHMAELRKRAAEAEAKLKRLYDAIENGIADVSDPPFKDRVTELKAIREQARADAERAEGALDRAGLSISITPQALKTFQLGPQAYATESGGYRRDHRAP